MNNTSVIVAMIFRWRQAHPQRFGRDRIPLGLLVRYYFLLLPNRQCYCRCLRCCQRFLLLRRDSRGFPGIVSWTLPASRRFLDTCTVFVVAFAFLVVLAPLPFSAVPAPFALALLLAVAPLSKVAFPPAVAAAAFPPVAAVAFSTFSVVSVAAAFDEAVAANFVVDRQYYCERW